MPIKYLNRSELNKEFPVPKSRPGLRQWVKRRNFPSPIYPSPNTPMWRVDEVALWFENCPRNHQDAKVMSHSKAVSS